jgi:hypothetical protein
MLMMMIMTTLMMMTTMMMMRRRRIAATAEAPAVAPEAAGRHSSGSQRLWDIFLGGWGDLLKMIL